MTIDDLGRTDTLSSEGIIGQAFGAPVQINRFNIVCLSTSDLVGKYQSASVLVGYFINETMEEVVEQFTFDCAPGPLPSWSASNVQRAIPMLVDFKRAPETSCSICEHPEFIGTSILDYNPSTHCVGKWINTGT